MRAQLVFVPPGGGEQDFALDLELPGVPNLGDVISIKRDDPGTEDFIVKRVWWRISAPDVQPVSFDILIVECEFAIGPNSNQEHLSACENYRRKKGKIHTIENTPY